MKKFWNATLVAMMVLSCQANVNAQEQILGLDNMNNIIQFSSDTPAAGIARSVNNLAAGENLIGIDFRSGTGQLYAVGDQNNVYRFDPISLDATIVGNFADGVSDDPAGPGALSGNSFAFDFNPALAGANGEPRGTFARIISDTNTNRVINGITGEYLGGAKTDVFFPAGDANVNADPNIQGIAYTNSTFAPTSTLQYGIDSNLGVLTTVANNAGTLDTVGSLGVDFNGDLGFDISGVSGDAYAALALDGGPSSFYQIDLGSGAATNLGIIGNPITGNANIRSLTVIGAAVPEPSSLSLLALGMTAIVSRRRRS